MISNQLATYTDAAGCDLNYVSSQLNNIYLLLCAIAVIMLAFAVHNILRRIFNNLRGGKNND